MTRERVLTLEELIKGPAGANPTPLVLVIDELDRCRPDYALEILEVIKHFFAVPMVHFVLGVNLGALENSVKARYGHGIDATTYLQKFISLTLNLPDQVGTQFQSIPAVLAYAAHAAGQMKLSAALVEEIVGRQLPVILFGNYVSIRDVSKILAAMSLLPAEISNQNFFNGVRSIVVNMIITRVIRRDLFEKMLNGNLSEAELASYLSASSKRIDEKAADGSYNADYHHQTWCLYRFWQMILTEGRAKFEGDMSVRKQFTQFGDSGFFRALPKRIFNDYLNTFQIVERK